MPRWRVRALLRRAGLGSGGPDGGGTHICSWPATVCHAQAAYARERVPIEVTHDGPPCEGAAGPCEVDIFDDVIRVRTTTLEPDCDITCPPVCIERTDTCLTPELPEGSWRVIVDGIEDYESTIVVGDIGPLPGVTCGRTMAGG